MSKTYRKYLVCAYVFDRICAMKIDSILKNSKESAVKLNTFETNSELSSVYCKQLHATAGRSEGNSPRGNNRVYDAVLQEYIKYYRRFKNVKILCHKQATRQSILIKRLKFARIIS